ncbi:hypothetical protein [Sporosarcina trichiuri]|uniref:hypothetical protein n=1 Tax=Sporosarcina trichiuri TaxID=3056445 RepID=UPI0025B422EC|nr:hypothetical protein [Sporosarcina sp. 0.2-SM1T-5]WJY26433.1 hypothetical protein QWT68_10100 [Sporosarcina sp. 0.2-SM1T-5]
MQFIDYLNYRHNIQPGARKLSEVSAEQYANRLHNLQRKGIYHNEDHVTEEMLAEIEKEYKRGLDLYPRTIRYYIEYMEYEAYLNEGNLLAEIH